MPRIRRLVVHDSVVVRKVPCETPEADSNIETAGAAADGNNARSKISTLNPYLITLDVEMRGTSGLEDWNRRSKNSGIKFCMPRGALGLGSSMITGNLGCS